MLYNHYVGVFIQTEVGTVTFGKIMRAIGSALLYFWIYYAFNLAVVLGSAFVVAFNLVMTPETVETIRSIGNMSKPDAEIMASNLMSELTEVTAAAYLEFVTKYAVELTVLAGVFAIAAYMIIFAIRKKSFRDKIGLHKISPVNGVAMLLFGGCLNVFISTLLSFIPLPESWVSGYTETTDTLIGQPGILTIIMVGILAPIIEEVVFRGMCYGSLKKGMPMLAAMILSSWGFGMMHIGVLWVIYTTAVGLVFVWCYEKHRSIIAPILVHVGFNLMGQAVGLLPELSGSAYAAMLAASGLACAVIVMYVMKTSKYKIEYVMSSATAGHDGTENNNQGEQ